MAPPLPPTITWITWITWDDHDDDEDEADDDEDDDALGRICEKQQILKISLGGWGAFQIVALEVAFRMR